MTESKPCQYIAGEKLDDAHKCGKDCEGRSLYCKEHHASTHRDPNKSENQDGNYKRYTL